MDEGQRWTPGAPTATDLADGTDWDVVRTPRRTYLGDPRWGITADVPPTAPVHGTAVTATLPVPAPVPVGATPSAPFAPIFVRTSAAVGPQAMIPPLPAHGPSAYGVPSFPPAEQTFRPVRTKNPAWVTVLALLGVLGLVGGIAAAVVVPMFLGARPGVGTAALRTDLTSLAAAEAAVHARTGSYSADPEVVSTHLSNALVSQVAILWADGSGWCAQAVPAGRTGPVLYASSAAGLSSQSCG